MPKGRILLKRISVSKKLPLLKNDGARLLYTWLIPHVDVNGCFSADPEIIKGKVFTKLHKTSKSIAGYLQDLVDIGSIIVYRVNGEDYLHIPDFADKQPYLNPDREAKPHIPLPTPDQLETYSRLNPPESKRESETKPKAKEKVKAKENGKGKDSLPQSPSTSASLRFNDSLQAIIQPRTSGDRTSFRNLTNWLQIQIQDGKKDESVYGRVLDIAKEAAKKGRVPPAMFFDILKREMGYTRQL